MKCLGAKAFTLIELLVIIATVGLLVCVLMPTQDRQRERAKRIQCTNNLKNIGLAFKTWALDSRADYPMNWKAKQGGTLEFTTNGEVFRPFQVISNGLETPKVLVCPADTRIPATNFSSLSNSNLSYFVGIDAQDAYPQMFLSGDRNLTNRPSPLNRILEVTTNTSIGWSHELHNRSGNVLLCDGSVQQLSSSRLQSALQDSGVTNRLAIP
jgi:prepilin-type processing-associated H-X9-DG protein